MWRQPPPRGGFPAREAVEPRKVPIALIVIIAVGVALIAGGAIAYFTLLRPKGSAHEAQETLDTYFNALGKGDTDTVKSLHTSENQPSAEELSVYSLTSSFMSMSYKDIRLETVKESADEMEVEIVDYSLTISAMGQSDTVKMSEMKSKLGQSEGNLVVKIKEENGKWLVDESNVLSPFAGIMPSIPDMPSVPPTQSGST